MTLDQARQINREVNERMTWTSDREVYGVDDFWATLKEIKERFGDKGWKGDCDDHVGAKYQLMKEAGCPIDQLGAIICTHVPSKQCHMVLGWWEELDDPWILDNIDPIIYRLSERTDLGPLEGEDIVICFNEEKIWDLRKENS